MPPTTAKPFVLDRSDRDPVRRSIRRAAVPAVERALGLPVLNDIYAEVMAASVEGEHFADTALKVLGIDVRVHGEGLGNIPRTGPLVVVANHPFGGVEGLILCSLLRRIRPDVKLLANYLLSAIPELRDTFFFVDPFGGPDAARRNLASMREAIEWTDRGGTLGVFPSGEVSHLHLRQRTICDPPWSKTVGKIVQRTSAAVVPVFFHGRNSAMFQVMGLVHPRLRTAMLVREMLRQRNRRARVHVGTVIPAARTAGFVGPDTLTDYLHVRTYILKSCSARRTREDRLNRSAHTAEGEPVIAPQPVEQMADEIAGLPETAHLLRSGDTEVFFGSASQFPTLLREVGRLREIAFRKVGEGTGQPVDLDRFDDHYLHLVVWNREAGRVVGAYRMGLTDRIVPEHGVRGLYTSTLFRFRRRLLEQIGPAIELGRSFVHPEDQRGFRPLLLLWQGIGRFLAKHTRYRHLFGTVSISADYTSMSKRLLVDFLQTHRSLPKLAGLLKPKHPPKLRRPRDWEASRFSTVVDDVGRIDELLADLEADGKTMPVLLRQYLKLNGKLLGFNIDPEFGHVLDGLILVDVPHMPRPLLTKYVGADAVPGYLARHGVVK